MPIVYVNVSIINHTGQTVMSIGGSFPSEGSKLLPDGQGKTWRDLFIKGFLSPPIKEDHPFIETASGKTVIFGPSDLYREGKPPHETRRRYGRDFRVEVKSEERG